MNLTKKKSESDCRGKNQRRMVKINDSCSMVLPDTYESEKWLKKEKEEERPVAGHAKKSYADVNKMPVKQMSKQDKLKVRVASMKDILKKLS